MIHMNDPLQSLRRKTLAALVGAFLLAPGASAQTPPANTGEPAAPGPTTRTSRDPQNGPGIAGAGTVQIGSDAAGAGPDNAGDEHAPPAGALTGRPSVTVTRAAAAPRLDGRLDDAIWRTAAHVSNFVQERPVEGAPASEATDVYIAYDSQRIYFGIYAHYSNTSLIRANRVDRDQIGRDDTVAVYFDPFLDQQRGYSFEVNAYGVQGDALLNNSGGPGGGGGGFPGGGGGFPGGGGGGGGGRGPGGGGGGGAGARGSQGDSSWDALFESAGALVEDGWTAEMAIPFKSLRYPARRGGQMHRWGFQIQRTIESKDEVLIWAPTSRDVMGFLRQMGLLDGMSGLSTSRNLEILPTVTAIQAGSLNTTTAAYSAADTEEGGVGVKYGLTSNLTLDFAFNPDFSQIESDRQQIDVNQRFPLFFPELRPFFLEGQEVFAFQGPVNLIHTRTIVDPRYGAKVTGKAGRTTVGLVIANDEAPGKVDDPLDSAFGQSAQVLLGRVRYDLASEQTVGAIVTDREFLDSYSRAGGLDGQFRIGRNHRLGVKAVATRRRDVAGVESSGWMSDVSFRKEGRNLSYGVMNFEISPNFKTDMGFVRRVDQRQTGVNLSYRWWPQAAIINWGPQIRYSRNYGFDGVLNDEQFGTGVNLQFAKAINVNAAVDRDMERYRGVNFDKTRYNFGGGVNTSRKISFGGFVSLGDQVRYITAPFLGDGSNLSLFTTVRPFSRLQSDISLSTSRLVDPRNDTEAFDIKILRAQTTYQFTERLLVRNIMEVNDYDKTLGANVLVTYRVNSGTAFYVGYDDRYRQGDQLNAVLLPTTTLQRTNRAFFTKLQVLFRY